MKLDDFPVKSRPVQCKKSRLRYPDCVRKRRIAFQDAPAFRRAPENAPHYSAWVRTILTMWARNGVLPVVTFISTS